MKHFLNMTKKRLKKKKTHKILIPPPKGENEATTFYTDGRNIETPQEQVK